jgi:hypothetical protein
VTLFSRTSGVCPINSVTSLAIFIFGFVPSATAPRKATKRVVYQTPYPGRELAGIGYWYGTIFSVPAIFALSNPRISR